MSTSWLDVRQLTVRFQLAHRLFAKRQSLQALTEVSLTVRAGEALGIVGESGCGKSTLARAILQLIKPDAGSVVWMGRSLEPLTSREMRPLRRDLQVIFQDPLASLDPRMTVGEIIAEPLRVHEPRLNRGARRVRVGAMLERVGLSADVINRYPHEFSGGQCQRIGIARAMIVEPKLLICDEPVSALDVSIQAQVINLLKGLQQTTGMSIIFVSHNLAVVRRLCDRVLVLYLGRVVELATTQELYERPTHPYTRGLLQAVPVPDPALQPARLGTALRGELPSPLNPPSGCVFRTRCPQAQASCALSVPVLERIPVLQSVPVLTDDTERAAGRAHEVACLRWRELLE
jgi:oligopeptide transport system ATP-binding protein